MTTLASVHCEFLADADGVDALDRWLEQATRDWPAQAAVLKARVCAAEAAANVMEHGSAPGRTARVEVRLSQEPDAVVLELADDGRPFDPTRPVGRTAQTLESATPGGRGLRTIQGLARELAYRREAGRNRLSLKIDA